MSNTIVKLAHVLPAAVNEVQRLLRAGEKGDLYKKAFSNVTGTPIDEVTPAQRKALKTAAFGVMYGFRGASLREVIGYTGSMDFGSELGARARKRYAEVMAKREELACAWLAQTGLLPSDSVICEDAEGRFWVTRKSEDDLTRRMANYLNYLHAQNAVLLDELDALHLARQRQIEKDSGLGWESIFRTWRGDIDRDAEEYEREHKQLAELHLSALGRIRAFEHMAGEQVVDLARRLRDQMDVP